MSNLLESIVEDARTKSKRAKQIKNLGERNFFKLKIILKRIDAAVEDGKFFVNIEDFLHNEKIEEILRNRNYTIGPDFERDGQKYFTIFWPED